MNIDKRLLAYKPISITLNFDWDKMTYEERVLARHNYIEEQKKKDPNYIGYDFIEVLGSLYGPTKETKTVQLVDRRKLISTVGQTVSIWKNELYTTFGSVGKDGYCYLHFKKKGKDRTVTGHRAVASTFIPIPEHLKEHRSHLVINHKNDVKTCNHRSNLEWDTQLGNCRKAIETGAVTLTRFKVTVGQPCELYGNTYYFGCQQDLLDHGLLPRSVYSRIKEKKWHLYGIWLEVTEEEFKDKPIGIPKDHLLILNNPMFGVKKSSPYVGTIVSEGFCKGERFVLFGQKQMKEYGFYYYGVQRAARSKNGKMYKGCTWEEPKREDCIDIPIGLTEAQKEHIFGKKE